MNISELLPLLTILVPEPKEGVDLPRFRVSAPGNISSAPEHFPAGFPADYPATLTDIYAREIVSVSEAVDGPFHVFIDLPDFVHSKYAWLPFTLALHAVTLSPQCNVFFREMDPVYYSDLIDWGRPGRKMESIRNFVTYLRTKTGDRARRVYEQVSTGSFVSFEYRIMERYENAAYFSWYYMTWLQYPYRVASNGRGAFIYTTHPFDHLPVRNRTRCLMEDYLTKSQMRAFLKKDPDIRDAVLMHDQINTVVLRPYWPKL